MNKEIRKMNLKNSLKEFIKNTLLKIRKLLIILLILVVIVIGFRTWFNSQLAKEEAEFYQSILNGDHKTINESIYSRIEDDLISLALEEFTRMYEASNFDTMYSEYMKDIEPKFYVNINKNDMEASFTEEISIDKITKADSAFYVNIVNKSKVPIAYTLSIKYSRIDTFLDAATHTYILDESDLSRALPEFKSRFMYENLKSGEYTIEIKDERLDKVYFTETFIVE